MNPTHGKRLLLASFLILPLLMVACDSIVGEKACYLRGEKIEMVVDANGDEWPVSGEKWELGALSTEVCVVSKKAVPLDPWGFSGHLLTETGNEISITSGDQFYWMIDWAEWTTPPEGWEDR